MSVATLIVTTAPGIISGDLTFFPLYLDMSDFPSDFWNLVASDGRDLRARNMSGSVAYPIDVLDINVGAQTGHMFVRVPIVGAGGQFRIDFGDASEIAPPVGSTIHWLKVWNGYGPVWAGREGAANADACWRRGANWRRVQYPAVDIVGNEISLGGGFLRAGGGNPPDFTNRSGGWIGKRTTGSANAAAWSNSGGLVASDDRETLYFRSNGEIGLWNDDDGWVSGGAWMNGQLTQIGYTHASTVERKLYQNGALLATDSTVFLLPNGGNYKYLGAENNALSETLTAKVKFAYMLRSIVSADWYDFEYANWFNPGTTLSYSVVNFTEFMDMAIVYAGTSIADCTIVGAPTAEIGSTKKDTNVSEGISATTTSAAVIDFPIGLADFWFSFYMIHVSATGSPISGLAFYNKAFSTSTALFSCDSAQNTTTMRAAYWTGSTTTQFDTGTSSGMAVLSRYDVHVVISDTVGKFEVYLNGALDLDFSSVGNDTKLTAATTIDRIQLGLIGVGTTSYSSFIIAEEDTRGYRLIQRLPTGAGAETQWTGAYTDIDETGYNDADYITVGSANQVSTFTFADLPSEFANSPVAAVVVSGRVQGSIVSPTLIQGVARVDGADYVDDPERAITTSFGPGQVIFLVNPETLAEWTATTVNAAEFGVKSKT